MKLKIGVLVVFGLIFSGFTRGTTTIGTSTTSSSFSSGIGGNGGYGYGGNGYGGNGYGGNGNGGNGNGGNGNGGNGNGGNGNGGNGNGGNGNGGNGNGGNGNGGNGNGGNGGSIISDEFNFNAKDTYRTENDYNISTKKIGYDFNLTIFETDNKDFSGTVYCVVQENDNNISDVNKTTWDGVHEKNITITNLKKISKDAYIYIKWESSTSSDLLGIITTSSSGDNNSTDHLSIMPTKYMFYIKNSTKENNNNYKLYAGVEYNLEVNATDDNDNNQSYNQILNDVNDRNSTLLFIHKNNNLEYINHIELDFNDSGIATINDFNISDIGKYTLELNDTNWTNIDADDTDEINRTIYGELNITVYPYSFNFVITHNTSNNQNWLYHSSEFNYTLQGYIQAVNKQGEIVSHFDKDEYATDVNLTLELNFTKAMNDDINLTYIKLENKTTSTNQFPIVDGIKDINFTINDNDFSDGNSSLFSFSGYINKKINTPISPIDMRVIEINATNHEENETNITKLDDNVTFYYPKLNTNDISTSETKIDSIISVLVYDDNETDANNHNLDNKVLISWYKFDNDNESNVSNKNMKKDSNMNSDTIDIDITTSGMTNGDITITIDNNTTPKTEYGIIHLDTPIYLWYSKYDENYSYLDDSSCINHYCIEYQYNGSNSDNTSNVGTGTFLGSEINTTYDNNSSNKGIKVFR